MRFLVEAAGSMVAPGLIGMIKESGNTCIASDANPQSIGRFLADDFCLVPLAYDESYISCVLDLLIKKKVEIVLPTLDDGLLKWSSVRNRLHDINVTLAISDHETLSTCLDKWKTYGFFTDNGIPTPRTSLKQEYVLVKPRNGRGGAGIQITETPVDMTGMISQELLIGTEYTVDVFCDIDHEPVYIVPRKRIGVKEGKSTAGEVVYRPDIVEIINKICKKIPFTGIINFQCFDTAEGIKMTEINPRYGGGTVLGMKATENWIPLTIETFCHGKKVSTAKEVDYGLKMGRYYAEVFYK